MNPPPTWGHVGTIFRSWVLLGRILCLLQRLLSLLAGFGASWDAPGSILEGSGCFRGGFWSLRAPVFRGFCVRMRWHCPNALNVTKPQFYWIGRHVASDAHNARNRKKSLWEPFEQSCLRQSCPKRVLELTRLVFGGVWGPSRACLGRVWGALGELLGTLGRLLGALGRVLAASWALLVASGSS